MKQEPRENGVRGLPVHFLTIVLNGSPFIRWHYEQFCKLPFPWHWHVVEGAADLQGDTAWSVPNGGRLGDEWHRDGLSVDGTSEYLTGIAQDERVTVYRRTDGGLWQGKLEMVNVPLAMRRVGEACLLWQVDADECWTAEQLAAGRQLFVEHPERTAAWFWCRFWVGPDKVLIGRGGWGNNPEQEWLRAWRYTPGMRFTSHEPPVLADCLGQDQGRVRPFTHAETEAAGLVFQHYGYATEESVRFKEQYYGYRGAVDGWRALQLTMREPAEVGRFLPWVPPGVQAVSAGAEGLASQVALPAAGETAARAVVEALRHVQPSPLVPPAASSRQTGRIVVDGVFWQRHQTGISRVWRSLLREWAKSDFGRRLLVLSRGQTAPRLPGLDYREVPEHDYAHLADDHAMLQRVCDEEGAALFVSTYFSHPETTPSLVLVHDMIPEVLDWDLSAPMWREKADAIGRADAFACVSETTRQGLRRIWRDTHGRPLTVAHNGCDHAVFYPPAPAEAETARQVVGRPYVLLVGAHGGYKRTDRAFRALAGRGLAVVSVGSGPLAAEYRELAGDTPVATANVSDDELRALYAGAECLLVTSDYEGFGLPVVEAMACGCPVVTTRGGALPEVAGEAAVFIDRPDDPADVWAAIELARDPGLRARHVRAGVERAACFSWEKMAAQLRAALEAGAGA